MISSLLRCNMLHIKEKSLEHTLLWTKWKVKHWKPNAAQLLNVVQCRKLLASTWHWQGSTMSECWDWHWCRESLHNSSMEASSKKALGRLTGQWSWQQQFVARNKSSWEGVRPAVSLWGWPSNLLNRISYMSKDQVPWTEEGFSHWANVGGLWIYLIFPPF